MSNKLTPPLALIADDDELMRSLIAASLTEHGFETVEVSNGRDAVTLLNRVTPDLVVLDIQMPVLDGLAACAEIRASELGQEIPIVIITGADDTASIEHAYEAGATDFINKPVNWTLLGYRMRYVMRGAQIRKQLREREADNAALLEAMPDRIVLVNRSAEILNLLEHHREHIAEQSSDAIGEPLSTLLPTVAHSDANRVLHKVLVSGNEGLFEFYDPLVTCHFEARVVPQSRESALIIMRDITEKKAADRRIHQLAYYDSLTGLPNRHHFLQNMAQLFSTDQQQRYALFAIDLDQFKRINDNLGHETGDDVLLEISRRLQGVKTHLSAGGHSDIARLSADEFVFMTQLSDQDDIGKVTALLDKTFKAPTATQQNELLVTASVGIALYPDDAQNIEVLLKKAVQAVNTAKQQGGSQYVMFSHLKQKSPADTLRLEFELRSAIDNDDLQLYFQPKYDLVSGSICGAEALLRWFHPERGAIPPAEFIPIAERSSLIVDIDRWVTKTACRHLREWQIAGHQLVPVSINISGRSFSFDRPVMMAVNAMTENHIDAQHLQIEITESVLMADAEQAAKTLTEFKNMGISLAIDDFGTGYSSLSYLKRFPLDVLKIDRMFIKDLEQDSNDQALCKAMISMAHSLDLEVVAEGIETQFQRQFLADAGCEVAQGYLLDHPLPAQEFAQRLSPPKPNYAFHPRLSPPPKNS